MRVGFGYDVHRLKAGRSLILGGISVPSNVGLDGHSDADVLTHAIIDALLGAAALGDIGHHFPDTDEEWRGADSIELLQVVVSRVREAGFQVGNVDSVVVLQRPKLLPYVDDMRSRLAEAMGVDMDKVSVKATTNESMGFVGRKEGCTAHAVALISPVSS